MREVSEVFSGVFFFDGIFGFGELRDILEVCPQQHPNSSKKGYFPSKPGYGRCPGNRLLEPGALGTRHWKRCFGSRIVLPGSLVLPGFARGFVNQGMNSLLGILPELNLWIQLWKQDMSATCKPVGKLQQPKTSSKI